MLDSLTMLTSVLPARACGQAGECQTNGYRRDAVQDCGATPPLVRGLTRTVRAHGQVVHSLALQNLVHGPTVGVPHDELFIEAAAEEMGAARHPRDRGDAVAVVRECPQQRARLANRAARYKARAHAPASAP